MTLQIILFQNHEFRLLRRGEAGQRFLSGQWRGRITCQRCFAIDSRHAEAHATEGGG